MYSGALTLTISHTHTYLHNLTTLTCSHTYLLTNVLSYIYSHDCVHRFTLSSFTHFYADIYIPLLYTFTPTHSSVHTHIHICTLSQIQKCTFTHLAPWIIPQSYRFTLWCTDIHPHSTVTISHSYTPAHAHIFIHTNTSTHTDKRVHTSSHQHNTTFTLSHIFKLTQATHTHSPLANSHAFMLTLAHKHFHSCLLIHAMTHS